VAAACLLPIVFYSVWIPMKTDVLESGVLTIHDFNPFYKVPAPSFKSTGHYEIATDRVEPQLKDLPAHVSTFAYELDEDTYIPIRVNERGNYQAQPEVSSEELSETVVEVPQNTSTPSTSGSQVIVGSFSSRANADILVQSLCQKGFDAVILESGSTIRVSAGPGSAYNTLAPKLRAEGLEPWLLK